MESRLPDLTDCIETLVADRALTEAAGRELVAEYNRIRKRHGKLMAAVDADKHAAIDLAAKKLAEAKRAKINTARRILIREKLVRQAAAHPDGFTAGAMAALVRDIHDIGGIGNAEARIDSVEYLLHRMFSDGLDALRPKAAAFKTERLRMKNFVRELYGENTGDALARDAAKAWGETSDYARKRFNQAGGDIGELDIWRMPQSSDARLVARLGRDRWKALFTEADRALMMERHGLDAAELDAALTEVFQTIKTDGLSKLTPGVSGTKALANRHQEARFLLFADAESWLRYNDAVGGGDVFTLLTGHVRSMSRAIGLIETLGPNPAAMARYLSDLARKAEGTADPVQGASLKKIGATAVRPLENWKMISRAYDVLSGNVNSPVSDRLARIMGGFRNVLMTAQLGSAPLSAISDLKFLQSTAAWNGLSQTAVIKNYVSLLNPANAADRRLAARMALGAESWASAAVGANRHMADTFEEGWTARLVDRFHRISGLTPMTQAGKHAFGMEFLGTLADAAGKTLDGIDGGLRRVLDRYGISDELWDAARRFDLVEMDGARLMDPAAMILSDDVTVRRAGQRIHEMIIQETRFAIPEPDARVRALMTMGQQRGTWNGEVWRSAWMYKSCATSVMATHIMRMMTSNQVAGRGARLWYGTRLMIGLTLMGALAIQLKSIAQGKNPRPMDTTDFWGAAFAQGGGIGILGDFLYSGLSRAHSTVAETLPGVGAGPLAGIINDLARLTGGNVRQFWDGRDAGVMAELVRFAGRYAPGNNLWYTRLLMERLVMDTLRELSDPQYRRTYKRLENRAKRDYGQTFYWRPGASAPEAPRLSEALGP